MAATICWTIYLNYLLLKRHTVVITKGFLNLQNRTDLLTVEEVTPDQWMECSFELQPTIYKMRKGDQLRLVLYTTDFEHTVRDKTDYQLTVDLEQSSIDLPTMASLS